MKTKRKRKERNFRSSNGRRCGRGKKKKKKKNQQFESPGNQRGWLQGVKKAK